jgi:hypothetical protein
MTLRARIEVLEMRKKASPDDENSPSLRLVRELLGPRWKPAERTTRPEESVRHVMDLIGQRNQSPPRVPGDLPK